MNITEKDVGREVMWQPIETAPKDGTVFQAYWRDECLRAAWVEGTRDTVANGFWPWSKSKTLLGEPGGFRVVGYSPRLGGWYIEGNFETFTPTHWMPLPPPPDTGEK